MPNLFIRIAFFLSAYSPLWFLIALEIISNKTIPAWGKILGPTLLSLAGLISTIALILYLRVTAKAEKTVHLTLKKVGSRDDDAMIYIGTYMLPFINPSFDRWTVIVSFIVTFSVLGILHIRGNRFTTNPIMALLGYHYFDIEIKDDHKKFVLIGKWSNVNANKELDAVPLGNFSFLEAKQQS